MQTHFNRNRNDRKLKTRESGCTRSKLHEDDSIGSSHTCSFCCSLIWLPGVKAFNSTDSSFTSRVICTSLSIQISMDGFSFQTSKTTYRTSWSSKTCRIGRKKKGYQNVSTDQKGLGLWVKIMPCSIFKRVKVRGT